MSNSTNLTSSRLLAGNVVWNLLGTVAPMVVAVFCIPVLIRGMGKDRFGVLTLAWAVVGYAGFFDLGLGRALTKLVAEKLGDNAKEEIPTLFWTSCLLMLGLGVMGALAVAAVSQWLVFSVLKIPVALRPEAYHSFLLLAGSIPVVIITSGLRGFLEAYQRFRVITFLRIPMGMFTFVGPLMILFFSPSLSAVVAVLVCGRLVAAVAHFILCVRTMPALCRFMAVERAAVRSLIHLGSWMTVSNVVGPLMLYSDRFLIGALISVGAVAFYATPYELMTKLLLIPGALIAVLFPAFSTTFAQDRNRAALMFGRVLNYLAAVLFPAVLIIVAFAKSGLGLWLGADFAQHSTRVLQWLAVGVFINSLAQLPFALIQSAGRPDLTAKLHLFELPCYVVAIWWLVRAHGIEGAAIAWTARATLDAIIMLLLAKRLFPRRVLVSRPTVSMLITALVLLLSAGFIQSVALKTIFLLAALPAFALTTWFRVLSPAERAQVQAGVSLSRALGS